MFRVEGTTNAKVLRQSNILCLGRIKKICILEQSESRREWWPLDRRGIRPNHNKDIGAYSRCDGEPLEGRLVVS